MVFRTIGRLGLLLLRFYVFFSKSNKKVVTFYIFAVFRTFSRTMIVMMSVIYMLKPFANAMKLVNLTERTIAGLQ